MMLKRIQNCDARKPAGFYLAFYNGVGGLVLCFKNDEKFHCFTNQHPLNGL